MTEKDKFYWMKRALDAELHLSRLESERVVVSGLRMVVRDPQDGPFDAQAQLIKQLRAEYELPREP